MSVSLEPAMMSVTVEQTCVEKLAQLFATASPLRIPVRVSTLNTARRQLHEHTTIEFGTSHEVLFASNLPLEFEDRVHLTNSDGSLDANANVVAVRYHCGRKAVAVRFADRVKNWIVQP